MRVTLVAYTPNPDQVCDMAARTCTSSECPELSTAVNKTRALEHALESGHESVAEHVSFTFQVEGVSRVTEIQLVRHRLASYSIQSGRYCMRGPTNYVFPKSIADAVENELMNGGGWSPKGGLQDAIRCYERSLKDVTERMRKLGVPEEDIRYLYPQGLKTSIVVTMNARELRHFFEERCCVRAQWEIRELAERMLEEVRAVSSTLFEDAGPKCLRLGYCPEKKGCGLMKPKEAKE